MLCHLSLSITSILVFSPLTSLSVNMLPASPYLKHGKQLLDILSFWAGKIEFTAEVTLCSFSTVHRQNGDIKFCLVYVWSENDAVLKYFF